MTGDELSAAMQRIGLGANELARRLNVSTHTVRRWIAGTRPIPDNLAAWITHLASNNGQGPRLPDGW